MPRFVLAFVAPCWLNSALPVTGAVGAALGLRVAIATLGTGTSARVPPGVGWRHQAAFKSAAAVPLASSRQGGGAHWAVDGAVKLHVVYDPATERTTASRRLGAGRRHHRPRASRSSPERPPFSPALLRFRLLGEARRRRLGFVTRLKRNTPLRHQRCRRVRPDAAYIMADRTGRLPERQAASRQNLCHRAGPRLRRRARHRPRHLPAGQLPHRAGGRDRRALQEPLGDRDLRRSLALLP